MKVVIWILACVVLVGCESRALDTQRLDSSGDDVSRELATAVRRALAAKTVEDNRLAQYAVEKQRLVSRLMPNGDWADGHPLAIEGYVSERDPESAKNLSVVLKLEFMAAEAVSRRKKPLVLYMERRSERRSEQKDRGENSKTGPRIPNRSQRAVITPGTGVAMGKALGKNSEKNGRDSCVLSRGGSKFLSVDSGQ